MAIPSVLTFDAEGRAVDFEVWVDDLQLFLQCDRADGLSLFDLTSGASPALPATADSTVRSQWTTRDAAARLAGCSPSPLLPSVASAAAADLGGFESVGAASTPVGRCRTGKGKGGKGAGGAGRGGGGCGGGSGGGGGGSGSGGGGGGVGVSSGGGGGGGGGGGSGGGGGGGGGGCSGGGDGSGGAGRGFAQRSGFGSGPRQQQQRSPATMSPQQLCEWYTTRQRGGGTGGHLRPPYRRLRCVEGDCYLCVPPDPGIEAAASGTGEAAALGASASAAPGASESALSGTTSAQAFHTFTLDSGASRSFFRDRTTLTPLSRPVAVSLADPSGGPVLASFSTVLPCPAAPSGTLSGLYLPSFSTNLVSGADLQDRGVDQFTPASQRVTHCTLYTLTTESPPVAASGQVAASSQVIAAASRSGPESAPCSCRLLSHQTLLWHHHLGHPSLPRLRGMAFRVLVSGLPRSLPPLPPGPAPTCVPCVEGRQRAAPHSSEFPPTEAPLQTLHMDVWGPARVRGQGHERYFLLVVDEYSRYTTVFPLRSKGDVTESGGAEPGGAEPGGAGSARVASRGTSSRRELLSPQELREWFARRWSRAAGAGGTTGAAGLGGPHPGGTGVAWTGGAAGAAGVGPAGGAAGAVGAAGAAGGTRATGPAGTGAAGATGAGAAGGVDAGGSADAGASEGAGVDAVGARCATGAGAAAGDTGAVPAISRGATRSRPYFVPLLEQVHGLPPSTGPAPPLACPQPVQSHSRHTPDGTAASALVAELVNFAACCRLDYATSLVAASESVCPPSVGGECALSTDVLEDRQEEFHCFAAALPHLVSTLLAPEGDPDAPNIPTPRSYAEAIEGPYSSQWQAAMDAEMASRKSTGTYVDEVPPPGANITFSPTPKMTTLRVLLHVAAQRDYELHSLDFSTAFLQGSMHEEIWLRRPPGFTGSFPPADPSLFLRTDTSLPPFYILVYVNDLVFATADTAGLAHVKSELQKRHTCTDLGELRSYLGLQITRDRARRTITLTQSHMVQPVLQRFDFTYSSPQATPLSTRHSLSALPSDESVEPSGRYPELVGCLMYLMTCTRPDLAYPMSILARYVAPGRHRPEHMAAVKRVLRYLCSTSGLGLVLGGRSPVVLTGHADASSCEAEIYAGAMAAQELLWLTYLLTDLGEPPRSPPVLYVDNKVMLALCWEHRLEHRTKHIALRFFLACELQQRGQLRLAYVASQANTADIFTKALQPCDHQRFCTMLGLVPTWPHLLTS
ncbi:unnamed protein product [Closterium sp. NIES-54]